VARPEVDVTRQPARVVQIGGEEIALRSMGAADEQAVLAFARGLDPHELLFLRRDIRQPKVVAAWLREIEAGQFDTLLACKSGEVVGCGTVVRDPLSWSAHVAELRTVIAVDQRGLGLGTAMVQETFRMALAGGAEKVFAQMTTDQPGAIAVFEGLGFRPEAILREHVRDLAGISYDIVILSHIVAEVAAKLEAYGVTSADVPS
jgi:RimJ/RimL family protein N-acetyltransferase